MFVETVDEQYLSMVAPGAVSQQGEVPGVWRDGCRLVPAVLTPRLHLHLGELQPLVRPILHYDPNRVLNTQSIVKFHSAEAVLYCVFVQQVGRQLLAAAEIRTGTDYRSASLLVCQPRSSPLAAFSIFPSFETEAQY